MGTSNTSHFFSINVCNYVENKNFFVYRPASLSNPKSNAVMFVMSKYLDMVDSLENVADCLVFWPQDVNVPSSIKGKHAIVLSAEPRKDYNRFFRDNGITNYPSEGKVNIVNGAFISECATIGRNCIIMPGAYVGGEVCIGDDTYIGSGVKIVGRVVIGKGVVIRENTVIGADGLTTDREDDGSALTMPQFGGVDIGDKVQIGANTVICRGAIDNTVLGTGSKIDNSCFISHNVIIGENVFVVGETIMMGSSSAGNNAYISGNSTIRNKVSVGDYAFVGMGAVVTKNVSERAIVMGNPARERI